MQKQAFTLIISCMISFIAPPSYASVNQDISSIDQKISVVKETLATAKDERKDLEKSLRQNDMLIAKISLNIHDLNRALAGQQKHLDALTVKETGYKNQLSNEQAMLDKQIRSAYIMGAQNPLKSLVNQDSAQDFSRNNHYFYYFNRQRIKTIQLLNHTLVDLNITERDIKEQTKALAKTQAEQQNKEDELRLAQINRHLLITKLNAEIDSSQLELSKLNADRERLTNLVNQLQIQQVNSPNQTQLPNVAFASMQGRLPWPTNGHISEHFGTPINDSELTYTGILIDAPDGQTVHAIYPGTVIFSGWLKGFGLLMIIDHGNGYISLYARNRTLYQQVGARVSAGDAIAQVGESGGYEQSGLYFEVRHDGEPVDPELWCSNRANQWY